MLALIYKEHKAAIDDDDDDAYICVLFVYSVVALDITYGLILFLHS